ncbi:MAG: sigma-54-dependent Fis family transcriptional regulator, partial [Deltaproteobacteria bacterium]
LHDESPRREKPFAALNCTAISEQLLESELFGHERGAFTGATREHHGYFERVDGGTLFLDEIGDMPMHTQTKLLRVLEDGRVQRVGGEKSRQVDVRFIGATNIPLEQAVAEKHFRADLYHRMAVLRIHLPSLRERPEDIPLLAEIFLQEFNSKYGKGSKRLTNEAIRLLQSYLWPGNVRELKNAVERVVVESEAEAIGARAFSEWIRERQQFAGAVSSLPVRQNLPAVIPYSSIKQPPLSPVDAVQSTMGQRVELSAEVIRQAYQDEAGNLSAVARRLGIHRATLYRHLQRLNLTRQDLT